MKNQDESSIENRSNLTRRQLITYGGQGAALLGVGSLLAACGGSTGVGGTAGTTSIGGGKPRKGGTLNVGMITGGSAETLNPGVAVTYVDILRVFNLYDFLLLPGKGTELQNLEPRLATSAEPNKDATSWIFKLRKGVTWHDGKPFTADDVVWSVKSWGAESNYAYYFSAPFIDFKRVRKQDQYTVEIPMVRPTAEFPTILSIVNFAIIQDGATPASIGKNPVGTGPFKYSSFKAGYQSDFARNDEYWEGGDKPYLDQLVVDSTFQDETSRYNALLGGQIDVAPVFPGNYARQQQSSQQVNVLSSPSGQGYAFSMRLTKPPWNDQRVVEAMKLLCDRQSLIDGVLPGYADVGNDLIGRYSQYFAEDLKPELDVERAKALLKAAGQENLTVTLPTSNATPGFVEAATLYAQQAAQAGVTINVEPVSAATYYTTSGGYLSRPFGQTNFSTLGSLTAVCAAAFLPGCAYEETGWSAQPGGGNQKLIGEAMGELDPRKAAELWRELQLEWVKKDGHVWWSYPNYIDAANKNVSGLSSNAFLPLNNFRFLDAFLNT
jgi:peptide/nickel transport system substrate-binding protein